MHYWRLATDKAWKLSKFNNGTVSTVFNVHNLKLEYCKSTALQFAAHHEQVSIIFRLANVQPVKKKNSAIMLLQV